ncbi:hypothetical protein Tco_0255563 [Tanacetum coccineum]
MDTPLDFSAFVMNRLKVDTLTPEILAGPTFELMKGSCKSLVELEYFFKEVYKATTDQLDWNNPEGHHVIPFDHFINNDLAYLSGGVSSRTYTTSVTKTKAANYGHIKWIEDLVPNIMWSQVPVSYDKHALWGISHWVRKRQQFYGFVANRESARDVYSKRRIIAVTKLQIVEWHNYKHLDWITVRRNDDKLYTFKEGDFNRLCIQDIEYMLLLLKHCHPKACGRPSIRCRELPKEAQPHKARYNKDKKNRLMRIDELHKFSDGTLNGVRTSLDDRLKGIWMKYLPKTILRQSDRDKAGAMIQAIDKQLKTRRIMRSLEKFVGGRPYSNPMIQPEPEGSTQGYPLDSVEVLRYDTKGEKVRIGKSYPPTGAEMGASTRTNLTSIKVKEFQRSFRHSDTERLSRSEEVLKLKNFKKDATLKLFKSTNQEMYEHVGPEVTTSHGGKIYKMAKQDYAWLMISRCSRSHSRQAKEQAQDLKSMITD